MNIQGEKDLHRWYAGQALVGFMTLGWNRLPMNFTPRDVAKECWDLAEAMLTEERERDDNRRNNPNV